MYIAGVGLARGYLNKPSLTNDKFVFNNDLGQDICYKTGDLARWLDNGKIEYLGRNDFQVKVRGYRIELGEIEVAMTKHKKVIEAVANVINFDGNQNDICAFYTSRGKVSQKELEEHLSFYLAQYMLPARYYNLEKIPVLPNGKIDRKKICDISGNYHGDNNIILPQEAIEKDLYEIWGSILAINNFSIDASFFHWVEIP